MLHLIERILGLLFFCQPPILFYLNHKLKWRIRIVSLAFISFLLGWLLCVSFGLLHNETAPEGKDYPIGFILFIVVFFGWFISGGLLFLWSPIITFFITGNKSIRLIMALVIGMLILSIAILHYHNRYDWGVPGNHLLHESYIPAGFFDGGSVSVFRAENDLLKQKLINKWKLKFVPAFPDRNHPISFVTISDSKPDWWPSRDILEKLEGYSQVEESEEHYHSLWYDPSSQRLYVERGHW